jgi:hypothetical protein
MKILGFTISTIGTLMIAFAALRVHHRVLSEHKIDNHVIRVMKRERVIGITGVFLIIIGYVLELLAIS